MLGAWGLGWEIWMDGMEITQFTYFQQVLSLIICGLWLLLSFRLMWSSTSLCQIHHRGSITGSYAVSFIFIFLFSSLEAFNWCRYLLRSLMVLNVFWCYFRLLNVIHLSFLSCVLVSPTHFCLKWTNLQGVDHFKKIQYADGITYGELFSENE